MACALLDKAGHGISCYLKALAQHRMLTGDRVDMQRIGQGLKALDEKPSALNLSEFVVGCRRQDMQAYASLKLPSFHEIGSQTASRCAAPQPVFTRYKLL